MEAVMQTQRRTPWVQTDRTSGIFVRGVRASRAGRARASTPAPDEAEKAEAWDEAAEAAVAVGSEMRRRVGAGGGARGLGATASAWVERHPGVGGAALVGFPMAGAVFLSGWMPAPAYVALSAVAATVLAGALVAAEWMAVARR